MRQSELFYKTKKQAPKDAEIISHKLLLKADFICQLASGIYTFLPLGWRVHQKIENIIRQEMDAIGGQEIFMPAFQPKNLWQETDRWDKMDPPLFKVKDRHKKEFALGSTHEEVITDLVKDKIQSYKNLPLALYQIQNKFRNEMRFTGGLLRTREFVMKDLYSFHVDAKDLEKFFSKVLKAYDRIYNRCGVKAVKSEASGGVFTKEKTYEFQVLSEIGEDRIIYCEKCNWTMNLENINRNKMLKKCPECNAKPVKKNSIEVGHTFRLGTKYSKAMNALFVDRDGKKKPIVMGCYGIGIGRLMATTVEVNYDKDGIIWPEQVAPFNIHLIAVGNNKRVHPVKSSKGGIAKQSFNRVKDQAEKLYRDLQKKGFEVLYDDRDETAGIKFVESDLIGIPLRIVVSDRTLKGGNVELKKRSEKKARLVKINEIYQRITN